MKKLMLILMLVAALTVVYAQGTSQGSSMIKQFMGGTGSLIVKEFYLISSFKCLYGSSMEFDAIKVTDATTKKAFYGLKIDGVKPGTYDKNIQSAFLDEDEISSLLNALTYMMQAKSQAVAGKSIPYTEYMYKAKDNFTIGFYIDKGEYTGYANIGVIGAVDVFFNFADIATIYEYVNSAKRTIDGLKL